MGTFPVEVLASGKALLISRTLEVLEDLDVLNQFSFLRPPGLGERPHAS
jgi:hypothetical protein